MAIKIAAYANGDDALVAWQCDGAIPGCLGFALHRRRNGRDEVVENRIGWETLVPPPEPGSHRPSNVWPIQRFYWSDYDARSGDTLQYRVVPMITARDGVTSPLTAAETLASPWSKPITVSAGDAKGIAAYFNRGVVMSQAVARRLKAMGGKPTTSLKTAIADPKNDTRVFLAGQLGETLNDELEKGAKAGAHIYAALFELDDPDLIAKIEAYGKRAHIILSNGAPQPGKPDENAAVRKVLKGKVDLHNVRMLKAKHLAHNKFCVWTDAHGAPQRVWTGSQNWTKTGLCTQANNSVLIHDAKVAKAYRQQWDNLVAAVNDFTPALLASNAKPRVFDVDGAKTTLWFTANKKVQGEEVGPELVFARKLIANAKSGILFLMFNPGPANSLLNAILDRANDTKKPQIHVVGVINQDPSSSKTKVEVFTGRERQRKSDHEVPDIIQPDGLDPSVAKQWLSEITRKTFGAIGHAMIHSKVVVVDPFGDHPVVITGSHNLGPAASLRNDENVLIIENDPELARAYVVNIAALHNAYRWRFARATEKGARSYHGLHAFVKWQAPYFEVDALKNEIAFWVGEAGKKAPAKPVAGQRHPSHRTQPSP